MKNAEVKYWYVILDSTEEGESGVAELWEGVHPAYFILNGMVPVWFQEIPKEVYEDIRAKMKAMVAENQRDEGLS